jgi:selenocysteine-specific elongation factor
MRYVILGTAGHIDHGKSALVRAMTGTDPDRLKEEKERGITIDLGFANITYPDGLTIGIVDVPGHERLVRNMLAGAGGIDIVLMVIAADEGVMPQTREHLAICDLLGVKRGLIAVTKSDLVDQEWLELVIDDVRRFVKDTFLEDAEVIPVSSKTGYNIETLKEALREMALLVEPKPANSIFRLYVDRVFTLKGFGTVVTGTAISGSIEVDSVVEILPMGIMAKVRGLQSHGRGIERAFAGQRVAINLQGVEKDEIKRGDVVATPQRLVPSYAVDTSVKILKDAPITGIKNGSLVHFHTGSAELTARVVLYEKDELQPGDSTFCQFRFKRPVVVMSGDRFIIRRFSPLTTVGGGEILDPTPIKRRRQEALEKLKGLNDGDIEQRLRIKIRDYGLNGLGRSEVEGWIKAESDRIDNALGSLLEKGMILSIDGRLVSKESFDDFSTKVISIVEGFHKDNPLREGMQKDSIRAYFKGVGQKSFDSLISLVDGLVIEKDIVRLRDFQVSIADEKRQIMDRILNLLEKSGFQPPMKSDLSKMLSINESELTELLRLMTSEGRLVRINDALYLPGSAYRKMLSRLKDFFRKKQEMTVSEFRDMLNTTRKYALPYLEHLDSNKITLRVGDVRKLLHLKE